MRQDELTKESQKCDHGYYFGSTCETCMLMRLAHAVGAYSKWEYDRMFGAIRGLEVYDSYETAEAIKDIVEYCGVKKKKGRK